jgi:hypothetical protein
LKNSSGTRSPASPPAAPAPRAATLPPIGYRIVEATEQHGHRTKKILEIDPIQAETVRLIFRLAREGDGSSGPMGVKSITKHLNAAGIRTRDGGRWGVGAVHNVLTRTTYIGRHRFNTKFWKTRKRKPDAEVVEMAAPPIIDAAEFEAVQTLLKTRSPALTAPRITSGPTLLTGICFCAACGEAMTLRTGKGLPNTLRSPFGQSLPGFGQSVPEVEAVMARVLHEVLLYCCLAALVTGIVLAAATLIS